MRKYLIQNFVPLFSLIIIIYFAYLYYSLDTPNNQITTSLSDNSSESSNQNNSTLPIKLENESNKPVLTSPSPSNRYYSGSFRELKLSYFLFQDNTARDIYGHGAFMGTIEIDDSIYKWLHWFLDLSFLYKKGEVEIVEAGTSMVLFPISLGLKGIYQINSCSAVYTKIGPNWTYINTKQNYPYVNSKSIESEFGATFGIGGLFYIGKNFSLDIFTDYLYNKKTIRDPISNIKISRYLGGFQFGAGVLYQF